MCTGDSISEDWVMSGGAFAICQQLYKEEKADEDMKSVLYTVFVTDGFAVYEQFFEGCLCPGKSIDVYLTELCKLAVLFSGYQQPWPGVCFCQGVVKSHETAPQYFFLDGGSDH